MHCPRTARFSLLLIFALGGMAAPVGSGWAAEAPKSLEKLRQADLIIVGTIQNVIVESERSRIEQGFGNYDWGIYLTLAVEKIERGDYSSPEIECRCFRIKSRRSAAEYLSSAGHDPIPGPGAEVRVYLNRNGTHWNVLNPNGITAPDANANEEVWPDGTLSEAPEVAGLSGLMYTYLLPLELWGILFFVMLPLVCCVFFVVRYLRRRRSSIEVGNEFSD